MGIVMRQFTGFRQLRQAVTSLRRTPSKAPKLFNYLLFYRQSARVSTGNRQKNRSRTRRDRLIFLDLLNSVLGIFNDQNRETRQTNQISGHTADQQFGQRPMTFGPGDNQIYVMFCRIINNRRRHIA